MEAYTTSSVSLSLLESVRDLSIGGACNEEVNDRDGIIIQAASPAWGGILPGKRSGAGSVSVCDNEGISSSDIRRDIITRNLKKEISHVFIGYANQDTYIFNIKGITLIPAESSNVRFR
jgi:hypothetical protein